MQTAAVFLIELVPALHRHQGYFGTFRKIRLHVQDEAPLAYRCLQSCHRLHDIRSRRASQPRSCLPGARRGWRERGMHPIRAPSRDTLWLAHALGRAPQARPSPGRAGARAPGCHDARVLPAATRTRTSSRCPATAMRCSRTLATSASSLVQGTLAPRRGALSRPRPRGHRSPHARMGLRLLEAFRRVQVVRSVTWDAPAACGNVGALTWAGPATCGLAPPA